MTLLFITFTLLFSLLSASFPPLCCDGDSQVKVTQISLSYCCHQCLPSSPLGSVSDLQGEHRKFSISRWSSSEVQRKYLPGVKNLSSVPTEKLKAPIATRAGRNITKTTILIDTPEGLESSATSACWPARGSRACWTPPASWCTTSATSAWTWREESRQCRGCVTTVHMAGHVSVSVPTPGQQDRVSHWASDWLLLLFSVNTADLPQNVTLVRQELPCQQQLIEDDFSLLADGSVSVGTEVLAYQDYCLLHPNMIRICRPEQKDQSSSSVTVTISLSGIIFLIILFL